MPATPFADITVGPLPSRAGLLSLAPQEVTLEGADPEDVFLRIQNFPIIIRRGDQMRFSPFMYTNVVADAGGGLSVTCYGQTIPQKGGPSLLMVFLATEQYGRLLSCRLGDVEVDPWPYFTDLLTIPQHDN